VRLGHSDVRLTFGLYPSAVAEADRSAAEAVGAYFQKQHDDTRATDAR